MMNEIESEKVIAEGLREAVAVLSVAVVAAVAVVVAQSVPFLTVAVAVLAVAVAVPAFAVAERKKLFVEMVVAICGALVVAVGVA